MGNWYENNIVAEICDVGTWGGGGWRREEEKMLFGCRLQMNE